MEALEGHFIARKRGVNSLPPSALRGPGLQGQTKIPGNDRSGRVVRSGPEPHSWQTIAAM